MTKWAKIFRKCNNYYKMPQTNRNIWDIHYTRPRASQLYPDENVVRILKKEFSMKNSCLRALDLGAGSGRHLPLLSEHFAHTHACDFSANSLKHYAGEYPSALQAALPELPYADASFDFILCWGVLHYLPKASIPSAAMEIRRCLKPGGQVFLTLRSDNDTHLQHQLAAGDLKDGHARLFSKAEALALFDTFAQTRYGYITRQPVSEEYLVAHHMLLCQK
ncbi:MAG: class I SAM-dependent methyltransferase [Spirochaetes bacterium]|nr:class I SAM-dependent methyltransferase [Spirochaetota bacterium]